MVYPLLWPIAKSLLRWTFDVRLVLEGRLPSGNYIIASNHHSWLDPILITLIWPEAVDMMYIGPGDVVVNNLWKRWFIGGTHRVVLTPARSGWLGKTACQSVLKGLGEGKCLLIFPEGDIYPDEGKVRPFYNGAAYFGQKTGLPVVPVGLCGTADLFYRKQLIVHCGKPIDVPRTLQRDKRLLETIRARIEEDTQRLIEGYADPEVASKPMHWLTHLM